MLLKKIICTVRSGQEETFSIGQEQWKAIENCPGFIAQIGGWVKGRENVAMIAAAWDDLPSYKEFMENAHDPIYERTGQEGTIEKIEVRLDDSDGQGETILNEWLKSQNVSLEQEWSIGT
ncbi:YdbC family protein [Guptibacillus algicola]|uniref:YdbC family protein n=1 Tax=Guptibacillus algicola TaxID=225844 RepID=UPI001CD65F63|nr:YdbC family protein [Alkalihalobacillus algicola]MCA0988715.1 YdbC family protein [Alkalihalobacillus algicola]